VALGPDGSVEDAAWTTGVHETVAWIERHAEADTTVFVDAPLLVLNDRHQRLCEKQVGQAYGRWQVSANSTNRGSPHLAGVRLREALEAAGWTYVDGTGGVRSGQTVSECYPYTTIVGAAERGYTHERPRYKRKPRRTRVAEWRPIRAAACDGLVLHLVDRRAGVPRRDLRAQLGAMIAAGDPFEQSRVVADPSRCPAAVATISRTLRPCGPTAPKSPRSAAPVGGQRRDGRLARFAATPVCRCDLGIAPPPRASYRTPSGQARVPSAASWLRRMLRQRAHATPAGARRRRSSDGDHPARRRVFGGRIS
jgi:hypothetical protein